MPSIAKRCCNIQFGYFFSPDWYGLVNNILINMGIIVNPIIWNQDPATIMTVVILLSVWMGMGTGFLAFMAGLQNISKELLEAGRIDGIGHVIQELWYIIIPQMKPQLLFGAIMAIVNSFGVFDVAVQFAGMPKSQTMQHIQLLLICMIMRMFAFKWGMVPVWQWFCL